MTKCLLLLNIIYAHSTLTAIPMQSLKECQSMAVESVIQSRSSEGGITFDEWNKKEKKGRFPALKAMCVCPTSTT